MKIQTSKEILKHHFIADIGNNDTITVKVGDIKFGMRYNIMSASIEFFSFSNLEPFFSINKSQLLHVKYGVNNEFTSLTLPTEAYKKIKPLLEDVLMVKP